MNRIASRVHRPRDPEIRNLLKLVGIVWPEPPPKELPEDEFAEDENAENEEEGEEDEAFTDDEVVDPSGGGGYTCQLQCFQLKLSKYSKTYNLVKHTNSFEEYSHCRGNPSMVRYHNYLAKGRCIQVI